MSIQSFREHIYFMKSYESTYQRHLRLKAISILANMGGLRKPLAGFAKLNDMCCLTYANKIGIPSGDSTTTSFTYWKML